MQVDINESNQKTKYDMFLMKLSKSGYVPETYYIGLAEGQTLKLKRDEKNNY
jgi:hypothetical protein